MSIIHPAVEKAAQINLERVQLSVDNIAAKRALNSLEDKVVVSILTSDHDLHEMKESLHNFFPSGSVVHTCTPPNSRLKNKTATVVRLFDGELANWDHLFAEISYEGIKRTYVVNAASLYSA